MLAVLPGGILTVEEDPEGGLTVFVPGSFGLVGGGADSEEEAFGEGSGFSQDREEDERFPSHLAAPTDDPRLSSRPRDDNNYR